MKDTPAFNLEDLNGMSLKIHVGVDSTDGYKTTVVMGTHEATGITYLIRQEITCIKVPRLSIMYTEPEELK